MAARLYSTFIAMTPMGKQRPRLVRRANVPYPIAFTPDETVNAEARIQAHLQATWSREPYAGPVQLQVVARMIRPASHPKTRKTWPTSTPDWDNLGKLVSDAANGILWRDDSQVTRAFVEKAWCDPAHPQAGFSITVLALDMELEVAP